MDNIAGSAHQLQRAAAGVQRRGSDSGAVAALPSALANVEEALDHLAAAMVKAAHAIDEPADGFRAGGGDLSPPARALRWHLFHLSARLRGAGDACPDARRWARAVLAERALEDDKAAPGVAV